MVVEGQAAVAMISGGDHSAGVKGVIIQYGNFQIITDVKV